jgi:hypothetical protein
MKEYKMIKKIFVGTTIALVLFAGIFVFAKTSFAQDETTEVETEELEAPVMEALENEYQYQNGPNSDEVDAIMTQTRTRSRELVVDGECTGECDPIQQRLQDGAGEGSGGPQQKQNLGVDKWNATGVPQGSGPNNGAGNRGAAQGTGQGMGTGDPSTCPYYNETTP